MASTIALRRQQALGLSIVALDRFIQSTRESGYKSTASAIAELVDNAIQAEAKNVDIIVEVTDCPNGHSYRVTVTDDGVGMDVATLAEALRFGGSSRFGDRGGLGRFGMGLPNASFSQARRVTVTTWQDDLTPIQTYLDVDEIAAGDLVNVPEPTGVSHEDWGDLPETTSGTRVIWEKCDRLDARRVSTIAARLKKILGRVFRHFIWSGVRISINGAVVAGIDPLFVRYDGSLPGRAAEFGEATQVEINSDPDRDDAPAGKVTITFSELPVEEWRQLGNDEKRELGIANGAGVSVVRAGREVDFGWFFMGNKRKENYDDWWRCEVSFDPVLDDAFGITHTKQQIRPRDYLIEALTPILETTAKALNGRVRRAHADTKAVTRTVKAVEVASERDGQLRPVPAPAAECLRQFEELAHRHPSVLQPKESHQSPSAAIDYHLIEDDLHGSEFYRPVSGDGAICAVINPRHLFFEKLYRPLADGEEIPAQQATLGIQLVLLAAARAEVAFVSEAEREVLKRFRDEWSAVLEVLLR